MKIAVITPYHNLGCPYFEQCLSSVKNQSYADIIHVTIGDGCNYTEFDQQSNIHNIALPKNMNNFGDTPRSIGVIYAFSLGVDAVAFLDADNWYAPKHIESMVAQCKKTGSEVVTSLRYISHLDGTTMGLCPESDGIIFCDTNCLMVTKKFAEEAGAWWLIPDDMHIIDDRVIWDTLIHASDKISSTGKASVYYRTAFEFHYKMFNTPPPKNIKKGAEIAALAHVITGLQQRAKQRLTRTM